jgi:hypothetical protein
MALPNLASPEVGRGEQPIGAPCSDQCGIVAGRTPDIGIVGHQMHGIFAP